MNQRMFNGVIYTFFAVLMAVGVLTGLAIVGWLPAIRVLVYCGLLTTR
jgi:hypothetical protein